MAETGKKEIGINELTDNLHNRDIDLDNNDIEIVFLPTKRENEDALLKFCQRDITVRYKRIWELIFNNIPEDYLNDDILGFLVNNDIGLVELSHLSLSDEWLLRIYEKDEFCVEALFTVGLRLLDCEENSNFTAFIDKYKDIRLYGFLLNRIIHVDINAYDRINKYKYLLNEIFTFFESDCDIYVLAKGIEKYLYVLQCKDESELLKALKSCEYLQLIALSQNEHCSTVILNELTAVKNVKYAKLIHKNALQALSQRNKH